MRTSLRLSTLTLSTLALCRCGADPTLIGDGVEPVDTRDNVDQMGLYSCDSRRDTGYVDGDPFAITVVSVDARPVETETANAYIAMQAAAKRDGVALRIVSGFRTNAQQDYLYDCYVDYRQDGTCNCSSCNLAAPPGESNHQSGHALDLNTSEAGVYGWLDRNAHRFGFARTVPSEIWHWEYWNDPIFDGPCGAVAEPPRFETFEGDFDGDGRTDLATLGRGARGKFGEAISVELARSDRFASAWWDARTPAKIKAAGAHKPYKTFALDLNGDGLTDLATLSRHAGERFVDEIAVEISLGDGFRSRAVSAGLPVRMRNGGADARYHTVSGDFDGDGHVDLAAVSPDAGGHWNEWIAIERDYHDGTFSSEVWDAQLPQRMRNGGAGREYQVLVGDFNGDGLSDLAALSADAGGNWDAQIAVELSTGDGFESRVWSAELPQRMRNGGAQSDYRVLAFDADADGLCDLVALSPDAGGLWDELVRVERSTGQGFVSEAWESVLPERMRAADADAHFVVRTGDVDGDGVLDLIAWSRDARGGWADAMFVGLARDARFSTAGWLSGTPAATRATDGRFASAVGDFDGDGRADIATLSRDVDRAPWRGTIAVDLARDGRFWTRRFDALTPTRTENALDSP